MDLTVFFKVIWIIPQIGCYAQTRLFRTQLSTLRRMTFLQITTQNLSWHSESITKRLIISLSLTNRWIRTQIFLTKRSRIFSDFTWDLSLIVSDFPRLRNLLTEVKPLDKVQLLMYVSCSLSTSVVFFTVYNPIILDSKHIGSRDYVERKRSTLHGSYRISWIRLSI